MASKSQDYRVSTTNLILIMVLVCVLVILSGVFLGKAIYGQVALKHRIESKKSQAASQLAQNVKNAPVLIQNFQNLPATSQQEIQDALPTAAGIPELIALLDNAGASSGVAIKSISPTGAAVAIASPTTATGGGGNLTEVGPSSSVQSNIAPSVTTGAITSISGSLNIEGTYQNTLKFLTSLEMSARPIKLTNIQIQGSNSDTTVSLQYTTYLQKIPSIQPQMEKVK